ncbi:hypothetical protein D6745_03565 [Candidatus Woesearchaeota archaeon]|nr:MAG: hypothetical protein D6745_03565 [Candidatus Woesearchaeota archaeon]
MMDKGKLLFYSITALGISSVITQIILIREFLSVFYGNELVFGIILANWLLLTGLGAYFGKYSDKIKRKISFIIFSQVLVAFIPFIQVFLIRSLKNIIFPVGSLVGIVEVFVSSLILLLPYCLISGFLLTLFCTAFSTRNDAASIGKVYFIDNIGDILGGFLFSFVLIHILNPFQMIFFIMFINLIAALLLAFLINKFKYLVSALLVISFLFVIIDFNKISTELQFRNQELVTQTNSPYGNIVVTRTSGQLNFFENGMILFSTENTIANEETVHYAMVQHDNPKSVLLISGGIAGTTGEILKYGVENVDYVELDPKIIALGRAYTPSSLEGINVINRDARMFVRETNKKYDVVIIDLPDPSTAQINRFYTVEFFGELKKKMSDDGVVSLSLISTANYISDEARKLNSVVYNTLKTHFKNVIVLPGEKNFFIASDGELSTDIARLIKEKGVQTVYVNEDYLKGVFTPDRISQITSSIDEKEGVNHDFSPVTYYYHLLYWMSHFKANYALFIIIIILLMAFFLSRLKAVSFAIFTTGFASSSLEVVLLIAFQVIYGYVYHIIGLIITMFMLGLAAGSFYMNKKLRKKNINDLIRLEFAIVLYAVMLPFTLLYLAKHSAGFAANQAVFSVLTFIIAVMAGMEFPLASKLHFKKISSTAAELYNADLLGASLGALLVSAFLIPIFGLISVCFFIAFLNLLSGIVLFTKKQ